MTDTKDPTTTVTDAFRTLAQAFTRFHADLRIEATQVEHSLHFCVTAHADDTPKLIGAQGVHFQSLQAILAQIGKRYGLVVNFVVEDPVTGRREFRPPYEADPDWPRAWVEELMLKVAGWVFERPVKLSLVPTSSDSSTILLAVDSTEPPFAERQLEFALSKIFNAIGKAHGHKLFVVLKREGQDNGIRSHTDTRRAGTLPR